MSISAKQNLYNKIGIKKLNEVSNITSYKKDVESEKYNLSELENIVNEKLQKSIQILKNEILSEFDNYINKNNNFLKDLIEYRTEYNKKDIEFFIKEKFFQESEQLKTIKYDIQKSIDDIFKNEIEKFNIELKTLSENINIQLNNTILSINDEFLLSINENKNLLYQNFLENLETRKKFILEEIENIIKENVELFVNDVKSVSTKYNIDFSNTIVNFLKESNIDFFEKINDKISNIEKDFNENIQKLIETKLEYYNNVEIPALFSQRLKEVDSKIQNISNNQLDILKNEYEKFNESINNFIIDIKTSINTIHDEFIHLINESINKKEDDLKLKLNSIEENVLKKINEHSDVVIEKILLEKNNIEIVINEKIKELQYIMNEINTINVENVIKENIENIKKEQSLIAENYYSTIENEINELKNKDFSFDYEVVDGKLRFIVNGNETNWIDIKEMIKKYSPKRTSMSSDFVSGGSSNSNTKISEKIIIENDNTTFVQVSYNIKLNSEEVYLNGLKLKNGINDDYLINNNKVLFNFSLYKDDIVEVIYTKI